MAICLNAPITRRHLGDRHLCELRLQPASNSLLLSFESATLPIHYLIYLNSQHKTPALDPNKNDPSTFAIMNQPNSKKEVAIGLLNSHNIAFIDGNSTNWATESTAYNIRVPAIPALVVYAKTARQVQDVVSVAVTAGLKLSARCGGHSYASLGHGGEDDHLVVDLTQMSSVVVDPTTHIATIGAGARLGHVARGLYEQGERAISHGSCPAVGISGHILHGGYGWISHSKGLALDWLIGADVVLTSGTKVHCSETDNADLFWALRGAGSNFGIVTSFELKTFSAPVLSIPFNVALNWESEEQKIEGIRALVDFAVSAPAELNMRREYNTKDIPGPKTSARHKKNPAAQEALSHIV